MCVPAKPVSLWSTMLVVCCHGLVDIFLVLGNPNLDTKSRCGLILPSIYCNARVISAGRSKACGQLVNPVLFFPSWYPLWKYRTQNNWFLNRNIGFWFDFIRTNKNCHSRVLIKNKWDMRNEDTEIITFFSHRLILNSCSGLEKTAEVPVFLEKQSFWENANCPPASWSGS